MWAFFFLSSPFAEPSYGKGGVSGPFPYPLKGVREKEKEAELHYVVNGAANLVSLPETLQFK